MRWFRRKRKELPSLYVDLISMLNENVENLESNEYCICGVGVRLWVANRPYADMDFNGIKPPRWVANLMRPHIDRLIVEIARKKLSK